MMITISKLSTRTDESKNDPNPVDVFVTTTTTTVVVLDDNFSDHQPSNNNDNNMGEVILDRGMTIKYLVVYSI